MNPTDRVTKKNQPEKNPMRKEPLKRRETTQPDVNPIFWGEFILHYPYAYAVSCTTRTLTRCPAIQDAATLG